MSSVIIGCGGLGRELLVLLKQSGIFDIKGWYDDKISKDTIIDGLPVLGTIEDLNSSNEDINVYIGIGDPKIKEIIVNKLDNNLIHFPNLIHPSVNIQDFQKISLGKGVIIQNGSILTTNITLEDHVFINLDCTIGHDTTLGKYTSLMPSVNISGDVNVSNNVYFGTAATVINNINIAEHSIIGASACVTKDIEPYTLNVGIPSKSIKKLN